MNNTEFWTIIDSIHAQSGGNMDRKCELLETKLSELKPKDLGDFIYLFESADTAAYSYSLWGAAYIMIGGCSDDFFSDFRATLISQGQEIYNRALANPESLAEIDYEDENAICYEGFQYVHNYVADESLEEVPEIPIEVPDKPSGENWDENELEKLYPKLFNKYKDNF